MVHPPPRVRGNPDSGVILDIDRWPQQNITPSGGLDYGTRCVPPMNFLDFPLNGQRSSSTSSWLMERMKAKALMREPGYASVRSACGAQECLPLCDKVIHKSNCVDTELKINNFHTVVVHLTTLGRQSGP